MIDPEFALKVLTGFVGVVGVCFVALKYFDQKSKDIATAKVEARKPFSSKQQEVYFDLIRCTSIISNSEDAKAVSKADAEFWVMFWGAIPIVADEDVSRCVDDFADTMLYENGQLSEFRDKVKMRNASMYLARACRRSLGVSWSAHFKPYERSRYAEHDSSRRREG